MNTIQHYSKSLFLSLFLLLSIGNVWGWEHTFTKGTTIYYDLTQYGGGANIYNRDGSEFGDWKDENAVKSIISVTLTKDLKITDQSQVFKSGATERNGVKMSTQWQEGNDMIISVDGKTATWGTYEEHTIYFKNTVNWDNVYVYFYQGSYWSDEKGSGAKNIQHNQMTKISGEGTSAIYKFTYVGNSPAYVSFTRDAQGGYENFWQTEAVYRGDYDASKPMYIPALTSSKTLNKTKYYDAGTWTEYTTTPELCKMQYVNGTGTSHTRDMSNFYEMSIDMEKNVYYVDVTTDSTTFFFRFSYLNALYAADWNNHPNGTPVIANGNKVNADKDVSNWENKSTCYYQGAKGDQIRIWFDGLNHQTWITKMGYRLKSETTHGTFFSNVRSDAGQISFFATKNGTQCVQTMNNGTWQDGTPLTLGLSADGIFTATMDANGEVSNVKPYTGDLTVYNLDGNPRNYKSNHNNDGDQGKLVDFRDVSTTYYDHYHMEYIDGNTDLGATMGNHINTNIANKITSHLASNCNVRYEYNSKTNRLSLTMIAGSQDKFLSIYGNGLKDTQNKPLEKENPLTLTDGADWLYMADFQAIKEDNSTISAYLMATYNGTQSWILASNGQETGENASYPILGASTKEGTYNIMLMYDYKTNRITAGWKPQGNFEVENQYAIDANLLLTREEDNDVAQITIKNDNSKISKLQKVVLVMQFNRDKQTGESQYKFSLPFDCRIKDIYGLPYGYMNSWGIQRYNGAERARTGWFEQDRPTFWEWMNYNDTLRAGEGYSLTVDRGKVGAWYGEGEGAKYLFFPSMQTGFNITKLSTAAATVRYPDQPCNINLQYPNDTTDDHHRDRRKYDSNWKLIGPKNYNNIKISSSNITGDETYYLNKPSFVYVLDKDGKEYISQSTKDFVFHAFFSYFVQFAGTITWQQYTQSESETLKPAPRYAPQTTRKPAEFRIDLKDMNDNELDRTFVALSPIGTEGFDLNLDLTKIDVQHPMIYTISENTDYAGNTLSLNTDTVALVVKTGTGGSYTIALPNENNDYDVVLVDKFEQQVNVLTPEGYPIQVEPGITRNRFYLVFAPKTGTSQPDGPTTNLQKTATDTNVRKVLINGKIYIVRDNRLYDITGKILTR